MAFDTRLHPFWGNPNLRTSAIHVDGIATLGTITGGSGGTNATYYDVALTGGSGTGATADIVVIANQVVQVVLNNHGKDYAVSDTLSAATGDIGNTTGFSVPVVAVGIASSRDDGSVLYTPAAIHLDISGVTADGTWVDSAEDALAIQRPIVPFQHLEVLVDWDDPTGGGGKNIKFNPHAQQDQNLNWQMAPSSAYVYHSAGDYDIRIRIRGIASIDANDNPVYIETTITKSGITKRWLAPTTATPPGNNANPGTEAEPKETQILTGDNCITYIKYGHEITRTSHFNVSADFWRILPYGDPQDGKPIFKTDTGAATFVNFTQSANNIHKADIVMEGVHFTGTSGASGIGVNIQGSSSGGTSNARLSHVYFIDCDATFVSHTGGSFGIWPSPITFSPARVRPLNDVTGTVGLDWNINRMGVWGGTVIGQEAGTGGQAGALGGGARVWMFVVALDCENYGKGQGDDQSHSIYITTEKHLLVSHCNFGDGLLKGMCVNWDWDSQINGVHSFAEYQCLSDMDYKNYTGAAGVGYDGSPGNVGFNGGITFRRCVVQRGLFHGLARGLNYNCVINEIDQRDFTVWDMPISNLNLNSSSAEREPDWITSHQNYRWNVYIPAAGANGNGKILGNKGGPYYNTDMRIIDARSDGNRHVLWTSGLTVASAFYARNEYHMAVTTNFWVNSGSSDSFNSYATWQALNAALCDADSTMDTDTAPAQYIDPANGEWDEPLGVRRFRRCGRQAA
jgi:hypothetical protein